MNCLRIRLRENPKSDFRFDYRAARSTATALPLLSGCQLAVMLPRAAWRHILTSFAVSKR